MKKFFLYIFTPFLFVLFFLSLITDFKYFPSDNKSSELKEPLKMIQGKEDNPYEAAEFRYKMLATTKDSKDKFVDLPELRREAVEFFKQNLTPQGDNSSAGTDWVPIGPGNIGGRIRSILIKPSSPSTILIGAVAGGVWKSTNAGLNWTPTMDELDPIAIGSMVFDPKHPDTVFAGTGEGWGNSDAVYGNGIYRSTNFGDTWELLAATTSTSFRNVLRMASDTAGNIYAATKSINTKQGGGEYTLAGGLFKSTNSGTSWTKISSSTFADNYFNPTDVIAMTPSEILFAVNNNGATFGGIYRTTNGGTNWTKITSGLPTTGHARIALAQDPSHKDTLYSVFQSTDGSPAGDGGLEGIFMSTNRGVDWTGVTTPPKISSTGTRSYLGTQGWYDNVITVDPHNSANIYVGGVDMMKSTNRGTNWTQLTYWHSFYGSPVIHADHHATAYDPVTPDIVYEGNDGGIFKTTDGGTTWTSLNNGLAITQYYGGAVSPLGVGALYGGTQDNGHLKYSAGTDWTMVFGGDGGYAAVDQTTSTTAYEEYVYLEMSKTTDGGSSWFSSITGLTDATSSSLCLFISPFSMNPDASSVLIAGSNKVWITSTGATLWTASSGVLSADEYVSAVSVKGPSSPYLGYAGTTDGKIFKCSSLDPAIGLDTWTDVTPPGTNGAWVRRLVINSSDPGRVIACYSGYNIVPPLSAKHIWLTTDGGLSWSDISTPIGNVPVHTAIFDPNDASIIYAGTETGVIKTTNSGVSWTSFATGMPKYVPVDELVLQTTTQTGFAFTHGRSVYYTDGPLPVELASFSAVVNERNVTLNWTTSTEENNSGFDIERRTITNENWAKVGFVQGNGNSSEPHNYTFTENNLNAGTYKYRLKQIDYNGNFEYFNLSSEVNVGIPDKFDLSQNYPNPFNPTTKINYEFPVEGKVILKVYDISGREVAQLVNEIQTAGYYTVSFNASSFASGVYFYRLFANGNNGQQYQMTKKMMLIK
ncbi:MAG TPA: T9SS type A sorting domain-containing protein [Ignavibacteria bacterium]|nr:T9SS type A sorting domain-containing protein [Ignavibacteria bacterium]